MYPPGEATQELKGALSEHTHTLPPPPPVSQSLSHIHAHTERFTHANVYYVQTHRPGFPSSLLADCPPRGGMG